MMTTRPSPASIAEHDDVRGDDRREAGEDDEGRDRQRQRCADRDRAEAARRPALHHRIGEYDGRFAA